MLEIGVSLVSDTTSGPYRFTTSILAATVPNALTRSRSCGNWMFSEDSLVDRAMSSYAQINEASNDLSRVLRIENNSDFELHPLVNTFVATYQALHIAGNYLGIYLEFT